MSGEEAPSPPCDFCAGTPAVVYCRADSARLCLPCDRLVHGANTVSTRHARAPLCAACSSAAAAFRRRGGSAGFLCGNCDFEEREQNLHDGNDSEPPPPLHDAGAVEGYTGCPSIGDLAAILGVDDGYEKAAGDGWRPSWKEEELLRLEDVIVPTTSCHGLQPLVTPASPKDQSAAVGKLSEQVIRQLGELAKSEAAAAVEPADDGVQLPSWASSTDCAGFEAFNPEACQEAASMAVPPSCEHDAWIATDCNRAPSDDDAWRTMLEEAHRSTLAPAASSSAEPCLSKFVDISQICPSMSNTLDADDVGPATAATPQEAVPVPAPAKKQGVYNVAYPDRGTVISRYKEKRKNRRFGKQIRYESRKARADGRLRIKGRFAKANY